MPAVSTAKCEKVPPNPEAAPLPDHEESKKRSREIIYQTIPLDLLPMKKYRHRENAMLPQSEVAMEILIGPTRVSKNPVLEKTSPYHGQNLHEEETPHPPVVVDGAPKWPSNAKLCTRKRLVTEICPIILRKKKQSPDLLDLLEDERNLVLLEGKREPNLPTLPSVVVTNQKW